MKKIVCITSKMDAGGAETFLMKLYRTIDRNKYQMDFIVYDNSPGFYDMEIKQLGGEIYCIPAKSKDLYGSITALYKIFKDKKYDSALRMTSHSLGALDLLVARFTNIPNLVLRSTNSTSGGGLLSVIGHKIFFFLPHIIPTLKIAPSILAGNHLFGRNNFIQLKNGIPMDMFEYDEDKREKLRKELGVEDKFVIGHIGRFNMQKNHDFLINVFSKYAKLNREAVLILIGKGELQDHIKSMIKDLNLQNKVKFLGIRKDIPELLMAMDLMLFPSFFEGMPNVIIEAQATGLPCIISDKITSEVVINETCIRLDIEYVSKWVNEIDNIKKNSDRKIGIENMQRAGYDIKDVSKIFINKAFNIEK